MSFRKKGESAFAPVYAKLKGFFRLKERERKYQKAEASGTAETAGAAVFAVSKGKAAAISAGVLGLCLISALTVHTLKTDVYQLRAGEEVIGYVQSPEEVEGLVEAVRELVRDNAGVEEVTLGEALEWEGTKLQKTEVEFLSPYSLKEQLLACDVLKASGWSVQVDGSSVVTLKSEEEASQLLEELAISYQTPGSTILHVDYRERVEITQETVDFDKFLTVNEGLRLLLDGEKAFHTYEAQEGDTLWKIAVTNNISPYALREVNPDLDPEDVQEGQAVNLFTVSPYITVVLTEEITTAKEIEYGVVYEDTYTLYQGETQVKLEGVPGLAQSVSEVVKENGIEVGSTLLKTEVVAEPEEQVVLNGTKPLTLFVGSGSLTSPVPMNVSSYFGSRGTGRHLGIDLANPKGTPITAADDGIITYAGYSGSYGYMIRISHGDGLETLYAHCDTIKVEAGERVDKGQQIGTVGITGNATGYHLHFEVIKNGVQQNPLSYLE